MTDTSDTKDSNTSDNKAYDMAFHKLLQKGERLIIPFLNELFQIEISPDKSKEIIHAANEVYVQDPDGEVKGLLVHMLFDLNNSIRI